MSLVVSIALTHIRARMRQTLVGLMGVATGVGFSVMMAALMEGSQRDFVAQLVDAMPHISVTDQRREPPPQPAEEVFDLAQIHGLTTPVIRPGIKNPYALIASIESWVPGAVAPSVQSKAVLRFAGRDTAASIIGIDPRREPNVSKLSSQIVSGSLNDLYKSSNAIILGSGLAKKIGARVGNSVTLVGGNGRTISANVVALSRTGINQLDENQAHTLIKTAQILAGQTGLVNEIRVRTRDAMGAREVAERIEAETRYKSVSWLEANEDLLSAFQIRNFIMFAVVGAILLVASFGTYNIISTITHEKTRDIAILKSLGLPSRTVRRIFVLEALIIGVMGVIAGWVLGYVMSLGMGQVEFKSPFMDATRLPILYSPLHYILAGAVALAASAIAGFFPARKAARRAAGRDHQGRVMSAPAQSTPLEGRHVGPLLETRAVTRVIGGDIPTTLVAGIDFAVQPGEFVAVTGPSGSGKSSLLYLLGLLDKPTTGEVFLDGEATNRLGEDARAAMRLSKLGFVFQFHFLLPEFSALENVMLPMRALGALSEKDMRARATDILASLGLADHARKRPDQMSGGQRQRVAIARALANDPIVILADEPTGNLDTASSAQVLSIMRNLVDSSRSEHGKAIVIVTHDLELAAKADRRVHIVDGRIAAV